MIDKNRLEQKCSTWNIALTGTQLDQLDAFAESLVLFCVSKENQKWFSRWWRGAVFFFWSNGFALRAGQR